MCTRGLHSDLRQLKKMGDKDSSVTMEPLLSPTKSGKAKVKAARFQVNCKNLEMPIHDLQFRLPVWVLGREGKAKQQEEAMRRMVGLTRAVRGASADLFKS